MYCIGCSTPCPYKCLSCLYNVEDGTCFDCIAGFTGQRTDEGKADDSLRVIVHLHNQRRRMTQMFSRKKLAHPTLTPEKEPTNNIDNMRQRRHHLSVWYIIGTDVFF